MCMCVYNYMYILFIIYILYSYSSHKLNYFKIHINLIDNLLTRQSYFVGLCCSNLCYFYKSLNITIWWSRLFADTIVNSLLYVNTLIMFYHIHNLQQNWPSRNIGKYVLNHDICNWMNPRMHMGTEIWLCFIIPS